MRWHRHERRQARRVHLTQIAVMLDGSGGVIGHGRVQNASATGFYVICHWTPGLQPGQRVVLELSMSLPMRPHAPDDMPPYYCCRIAHTRTMGDLLGVGLEVLQADTVSPEPARRRCA